MLHFPLENFSLLDSLILGVVQIMISSFHLFMWYFLLDLYGRQQKGQFGTYNPITYKIHYPSWAIFFLLSGFLSISEAKNSSVHSRKLAFCGNIFSAVLAVIGVILIIIEQCTEQEMSYKNFGRAAMGKLVSWLLLITSLGEFSLTFTYIYHVMCNWDSLMSDLNDFYVEDKAEEEDEESLEEVMEEEVIKEWERKTSEELGRNMEKLEELEEVTEEEEEVEVVIKEKAKGRLVGLKKQSAF
ncbi:membrane-spanning 4-domains subfamily A member 13 [Monodelphis domestica]|uniref:Membrane spanning 4-domains A13 n=1 Tax=Monodelphis domestica TaxID=13616 RepID=F7G7B2_MONDO|nr:membrane-spanning 4-domains subfamily A member 13 [Monodelphis domestica]XP_007497656.1 membrane-spanning 4-domains subfamily A member 13 [Monodelphis domestica]XP_016279050.1 membrane-spanning 4-domains subfamily A member 13 [Monodelphis domestica]XP_056657639.1 membrane-spanning 4-domains subfamily A member 13 [Monodelphis domestica]